MSNCERSLPDDLVERSSVALYILVIALSYDEYPVMLVIVYFVQV